MVKRVSIYIDGANFVYGMKSLNAKYSDYHFNFENYIKAIVGKDNLVEIFYYNASLKQEVNPRRFKEQQKLLARLRKIPKCRIILCKRQKRFTKEEEEYYTIRCSNPSLVSSYKTFCSAISNPEPSSKTRRHIQQSVFSDKFVYLPESFLPSFFS